MKEPEDFRLWRETMETEFPGRFKRLFSGPLWSGQGKDVCKDPKKGINFFMLLIQKVCFQEMQEITSYSPNLDP